MYDYVFWIDSDSIFVDMSIGLEDLIQLEKDLVFTGDSFDVFNTGHFLLSNSAWSNRFVDEWLTLKHAKSPPLNTAHISEDGDLVDQPAANVLLSAGFAPRASDLPAHFNAINGCPTNKERKHKYFCYLFAPNRAWRSKLTKTLVAKSLRKRIAIVAQDRLNAYPFHLPGYRPPTRTRAPIMHFPGGSKEELMDVACE